MELLLKISDDRSLRPLQDSDAEELHQLIERNRSHLAKWLHWAAGQTGADTRAFIRRARGQAHANNGLQAAILCDGRLAGVAGYPVLDRPNRRASIGYWLAEEHQGRGTMTGAVRLLVDRAFTVWGLNRVEIRAATENQRSRAVPERLGFRQEAILRKAECVGGDFHDQVVYSALAGEWSETPTR